MEKTITEALEDRTQRLDSSVSELLEKLDTITEENARLVEKNERLKRDLDGARQGKKEEKAAIDHLFETGRRVWL